MSEPAPRPKSHKYFDVHPLTIAEWERIYYPLNVTQELAKMVQWCDANPKRLKKKWNRFVVNWLNAEHAKIQRQAIEARRHSVAGATVGRACLSQSDREWYRQNGIEV